VTGDMATRLRVQKENGFHLNGMTGDRVNNALTVYLRPGDREPGARTEGKHFVVAETAEADAGDSAGTGGRDSDAGRLLRALPGGAGRERVAGEAVGGAVVDGTAEFDGTRGIDGGALLEKAPGHLVLQEGVGPRTQKCVRRIDPSDVSPGRLSLRRLIGLAGPAGPVRKVSGKGLSDDLRGGRNSASVPPQSGRRCSPAAPLSTQSRKFLFPAK